MGNEVGVSAINMEIQYVWLLQKSCCLGAGLRIHFVIAIHFNKKKCEGSEIHRCDCILDGTP